MKFQQVRSYDNYIVANLQLNLLKDKGVSCYLQDEMTITIDPLLSPAIGGMKLMVAAADTEKALQLLDAAEENYLSELPCPACGNAALEKITHIEKPTGTWARWKQRLFSGSELSFKTRYHCRHCGASFGSLPE